MGGVLKDKPEEGMRVDRIILMAWAEGIIMDRDAKGHVLALTDSDEVECERAIHELETGGEVWLTIRGEVVSRMTMGADGEYNEELI